MRRVVSRFWSWWLAGFRTAAEAALFLGLFVGTHWGVVGACYSFGLLSVRLLVATLLSLALCLVVVRAIPVRRRRSG